MAILHRRVFYAKVGTADKVVKHLKAGEATFKKYGLRVKSRILTDWNCGRTDRVVWEWELPGLEAMDADLNKIMATSKGKADFEKWFGGLTELIHHAEVDNFSIVA